MREKENPDAEWDFPKFIDKTIACASLKGNYYEADFHTVYQALVSFTTGNSSEYWIDDTLRYRDGMISMKSLRYQLAGEGNATSNIDEADRLHYCLQYKNKRSIAFELFLNKCHKM